MARRVVAQDLRISAMIGRTFARRAIGFRLDGGDGFELRDLDIGIAKLDALGPWQRFASNPHTGVRPGRLSEHLSTGEQSPEAQLRELRLYAEHRGFPITREYVDQASGDVRKTSTRARVRGADGGCTSAPLRLRTGVEVRPLRPPARRAYRGIARVP